MSQQNSTNQTVMPYLVIYCVGPGQEQGSFGYSYLDTVRLQFSVFTISSTLTSTIVYNLAELLNASTITTTTNCMFQIRRCSSARIVVDGQDQNENFVYHGSVDLEFWTQGQF